MWSVAWLMIVCGLLQGCQTASQYLTRNESEAVTESTESQASATSAHQGLTQEERSPLLSPPVKTTTYAKSITPQRSVPAITTTYRTETKYTMPERSETKLSRDDFSESQPVLPNQRQQPFLYQPLKGSIIQQVFWQNETQTQLPGFESDFFSAFATQPEVLEAAQQQATQLLEQLGSGGTVPNSLPANPQLPSVVVPQQPATNALPLPQPAIPLPAPTVIENGPQGPTVRVQVPAQTTISPETIGFQSDQGLITLSARQTPLSAVMALIAERNGLSIICSDAGSISISVTLNEVPLNDALDAIVAAAGCTWSRYRNIITVTQVSEESRHHPATQGRQVQVIPLNYVSAKDIEPIITGLLSPVGKIFISETETRNQKKTQELIIVEDLPEYMQRVQTLVAQYDVPPRQVMIEAHILRVNLDDELRHGVNFDFLSQLAGADVTLETTGFANPAASPAFFLNINGTDLNSLLEALRETTDAKTLASPKVMVLNGQEAKIQIGERLAYFNTTTTETSTLQNVNFLDVGVVLNVTPIISDDGRILMKVMPKVSNGTVNLTTGLPNEETTEIDTTVMLNDGQGLIVGGLIQERDTDDQSKLPYLGDLWKVGRLFQRRLAVKQRSEVLIALVPRLVPYAYNEQICKEQTEFERASSPLFVNGLERVIRPEPVMPDAFRNPRRIQYDRLSHSIPNLHDCYPLPHEYYIPSATQSGECPPPQCAPAYKY